MSDQESLRACVVTCSDTAAADPRADRSGPLALQLLGAAGIPVIGPPHVVPDAVPAITAAVAGAVAAGCNVVLLTGGTGPGPRDVTPQALAGMGIEVLPGIGEAIRAASRASVPTTDLSRSQGGVLTLPSGQRALVVALPGSPGGVRDGMTVVLPLLAHAVAAMGGAGHAGSGSEPAVPRHAQVTAAPLDLAALEAIAADAGAGAVVTFAGRVRNHDQGQAVTALEYEAHPDAQQVLAGLVEQAAGRPGVRAAASAHRTGLLAIGDLAFAVVVSAPHRQEAFAGAQWLVEQAKAKLPIWKRQHFADGTSAWVNSP